MAENVPNPGGPVPPKPAELPKPQAKKETVRINLPPKPTASPTIKLPTLPAGGPPTASSGVAAAPAAAPAAASPAAPVGAPKPPSPGAGGARVSAAAHAPAPAPAATATRPAARSTGGGGAVQITGLDKGLAVGAAVFSVAALGVVIYLWRFLTNVPGVTE